MRTIYVIIISIICLLIANITIAQPRLQILGLFKNKALIVYKGKNKIFNVGDEIDEGLKLIAADSSVAVFDYKGEKYKYGMSFHISSDIEKEISKKLIIAADNNNQYKANIMINGNRSNAILDPNQPEFLISSTYADRIKLNYKDSDAFSLNLPMGKGLGYKAVINELVIDTIKVSSMQVVVVTGNYPEQPLLGKKALDKLKARIDKNKKIITLQK